jgi:Sulfotransferase family
MRHYRRVIRNALGQWVGVQGDLQIWWTPEIPVVYISNPKSGCSTIKHSLRAAQAGAYQCTGRAFERTEDPHCGDDCLRKDGLPPRACRSRYVISCVRNPFTRALSGFLDKVSHPETPLLREFGYRRLDDFETYLQSLTKLNHRDANGHFRPQHINLDYPRIAYDAIFFLENLAPLTRFLSRVSHGFRLERNAPHARGATAKLRTYYTDAAVAMVREIFARDFQLFGYSDKLADAEDAPGEMIVAGGVVADDAAVPRPRIPRHATPGMAFERALHYRRLTEFRLI